MSDPNNISKPLTAKILPWTFLLLAVISLLNPAGPIMLLDSETLTTGLSGLLIFTTMLTLSLGYFSLNASLLRIGLSTYVISLVYIIVLLFLIQSSFQYAAFAGILLVMEFIVLLFIFIPTAMFIERDLKLLDLKEVKNG